MNMILTGQVEIYVVMSALANGRQDVRSVVRLVRGLYLWRQLRGRARNMVYPICRFARHHRSWAL